MQYVVYDNQCMSYKQGRINHSGAPYQSKAGPFSHTHSQDFLWGALFFPPKVDDLFSVIVITLKPTMNVQMSNSLVKICQLIGGPPGGTGPLPWYNRHNG